MMKLNVDCLVLIFNELTDKNSLHSCILVNKEWCNIVVPILWKEYSWENDEESEKKLFSVILSCLPSSSRQLLSNNDIKLPSTILLKSPLFNYVSFYQFPNNEIIGEIVKMVFEFNPENLHKNLLKTEIYKLFVNRCKNVKELTWETSQPLPLFPGASTCFSQIHSLGIYVNVVNSSALYEMGQICKDLNELIIYECYQDVPGLISLINAQRNLKILSIYPNISRNFKKKDCKELGKALARKGNTISHIYLGSVSIIPLSFLASLINLKYLSIVNIESYEDTSEEIKYFRQFLTTLEFPDLEYLYIDELSCFKESAMIIEKSNGNILEVEIDPCSGNVENTGMLIKAIANNCPKIKKLYTYLEAEDFIHVKSLLLNCKQLKCIMFSRLDDSVVVENDNAGDELLNILTKFSPNSLTEIIISRGWEYSIDVLKNFLESCRERTLHYFGLGYNNNNNYLTEDHNLIIRKYVKEGVILGTNI